MLAGQKFHQAQVPVYCRFNSRQYGKGCHIHALCTTKNRGTKLLSPTRPGGEIGENQFLVFRDSFRLSLN